MMYIITSRIHRLIIYPTAPESTTNYGRLASGYTCVIVTGPLKMKLVPGPPFMTAPWLLFIVLPAPLAICVLSMAQLMGIVF